MKQDVEAGDDRIFSPDFMAEFYEAAVQIGEMKMRENEAYLKKNPPAMPLLPRIATGGGFGGLFLWDTAFCCLWAKHVPERFPIENSLDNLYARQEDDGFICREFQADGKPFWSKGHPISFNPPILAWAEWELYEWGVTCMSRLRRVYPLLRLHHAFCRGHYRRDDGLFFSDALGGAWIPCRGCPMARWICREA